jgi:hypothetical protein
VSSTFVRQRSDFRRCTYSAVLYYIQFVCVAPQRVPTVHFLYLQVRVPQHRSGMGANSYNESENLIKHELMDGAPIKGECVPIRLFLSPLDLTPTYRSVNNIFSVKYYLNLVLVDEEDRRYFKQQEVVFWRKADEPVDGAAANGVGAAV